MKKSLLTVVNFALTLINVILTAVIVVAVVPEVKNVNTLVSKVASAIDLDLEAGAADSSVEQVDLTKVQAYTLADQMTINLQPGSDGKEHYAVITVSLNVNKDSEDFKTYSAGLTTGGDGSYDANIKDAVIKVVSGYTIDEFRGDMNSVQDSVKASLNKMFGSADLISSVSFSSVSYQ
jgi:hypothetical protein